MLLLIVGEFGYPEVKVEHIGYKQQQKPAYCSRFEHDDAQVSDYIYVHNSSQIT